VGDSQYSDPPAAIAVSDRGGRPELPSISDREGRKGRSFRRRDVTSRPMPDMLSALLAALLEVSRSKGFAMRRGQMAPSPRCGIRTSGGDLTGSADDMATLPDGPRPRRYELVAACRLPGQQLPTGRSDAMRESGRRYPAARSFRPARRAMAFRSSAVDGLVSAWSTRRIWASALRRSSGVRAATQSAGTTRS